MYGCAEDLVVNKLGGKKSNLVMTSAVCPLKMNTIPICIKCEMNYSCNMFMKGVMF